METSTVINHQARLIGKVESIYSRARSFKLPSDEITKLFKAEIIEDEGFKNSPRHSREFIKGYSECMYKKHWENVVWVHPWKGVIYDDWPKLPMEAQRYYMSQAGTYGIHVYKSDNTKHFTGSAEDLKTGL